MIAGMSLVRQEIMSAELWVSWVHKHTLNEVISTVVYPLYLAVTQMFVILAN